MTTVLSKFKAMTLKQFDCKKNINRCDKNLNKNLLDDYEIYKPDSMSEKYDPSIVTISCFVNGDENQLAKFSKTIREIAPFATNLITISHFPPKA